MNEHVAFMPAATDASTASSARPLYALRALLEQGEKILEPLLVQGEDVVDEEYVSSAVGGEHVIDLSHDLSRRPGASLPAP